MNASSEIRNTGVQAEGALSILSLGPDTGTSRHRLNALRRLGHEVVCIDPDNLFPFRNLIIRWTWKTGALFLERAAKKRVLKALPDKKFDLVWVDGGVLLGPSVVKELKRRYGTVINYNTDDPYGTRDAPKWRLYLKAVPFYDLIVVLRKVNFAEAEARGAQKTLWVTMSVDEEAHARTAMTPEEIQKWSTDVLFVGTWMPERGPLIAELIRLGIPLSIYGSRWDRAKEWPIIQKHWRGPELSCDGDYARAIQCAKVCIGLVSKGNRDESTTRSFEIPYLGSVLCAYRTQEHTELYEEGREAVFWSTAEECAAQCRKLLADENYRQQVAENGRLRCIRNGATNEGRLSQVLSTVLAGQPALQKK